MMLLCAWVLWWYGAIHPVQGARPLIVAPTWHPMESYTTDSDCRRAIATMKRVSDDRVVCLPDTVNPRGSSRR